MLMASARKPYEVWSGRLSLPNPADIETEELLDLAAAGDAAASYALLNRHRDRLKRMLHYRLDERLAGRLDESDVIQETLAEAANLLPKYLVERPIPFYPWLRRMAASKLSNLRRFHLQQRRSVGRELLSDLPDHSAVELVQRLISPHSSPSHSAGRRELCARVREALAGLKMKDRELLVLHHLERLTLAEAAAVLEISEEAAKSRRRRALLRLGVLLKDLREEFRP